MKSLLYGLLSMAAGHLTGISTCTDPASPGEITFFLATYHGYTGAVAPGTVHIQAPSGTTSTFSLDQSAAANPIWNGAQIMTGSEWTANIKSTYGFGPDLSPGPKVSMHAPRLSHRYKTHLQHSQRHHRQVSRRLFSF